MRAFSLELSLLAGWHDGEHVNIAKPESAHVVFHESIHADIFQNTPDGQFSGFCMLFLESVIEPEDRQRCEVIIGNHFESSRWAHESFATFIGANLFMEPDERAASREELTKEYRDYYATLDEITSTFAKSTMIRLALAFAIMYVVFSSTAIKRWIDTEFNYEALLHDLPDDRLRIFAKWWARKGSELTGLFIRERFNKSDIFKSREDVQNNKSSIFDSFDCDTLLFSDKAFARIVDSWLIGELTQFFRDQVPFPVLTDEQWIEAVFAVEGEAKRLNLPFLDVNFEEEEGPVGAHEANIASTHIDTRTHFVPNVNVEKQNMKGANPDDLISILQDEAFLCTFALGFDAVSEDSCLLEVAKFTAETRSLAGLEGKYLIDTAQAMSCLREFALKIERDSDQAFRGTICMPRSLLKSEAFAFLGHSNLRYHLCQYLEQDAYKFIDENSGRFNFGFQKFSSEHHNMMTAVWGESVSQDEWVLKCLPEASAQQFLNFCLRRDDINIVDTASPIVIQGAIRLVANYWTQL